EGGDERIVILNASGCRGAGCVAFSAGFVGETTLGGALFFSVVDGRGVGCGASGGSVTGGFPVGCPVDGADETGVAAGCTLDGSTRRTSGGVDLVSSATMTPTTRTVAPRAAYTTLRFPRDPSAALRIVFCRAGTAGATTGVFGGSR